MMDINKITDEISLLEPLQPTAIKLASLTSDKNSTVEQIVEIIRYDPALTADILKFSNSAFSASQRRIINIKDAVIRLGGSRIVEKLLGKHVQYRMKKQLPSYGYSENDLWRHSVAAATAAEILNSMTTVEINGLSFTAALLHDIGKLIIGRIALPESMEKIWLLVSKKSSACPVETAEKHVLGFSHADIGANIASAWQLPQPVVNAIRDHHLTESVTDSITDAVKIANITARSIGEGIGNEGMSVAIDFAIVERMGLTHDAFEQLCAKTAYKFRDVMKMFEI
jgi:putative nucleotidyltransferase with HDIG domain